MELDLAQYDGATVGMAGPIFVLLLLGLVVFTVLLIRNLNTRIRRVRERYPHGFPDGPDHSDHSDDRDTSAAP